MDQFNGSWATLPRYLGPLVLLSVDGRSRPRSLSLYDWCFNGRRRLVGVSSLGFSRFPEGVDPQRRSHPQKTVRLDKDAFLGRQPVLNRLHDTLGLLFFFLSTVVRGHILSLYTTGASMDGVGWLVCLLWASAGPQKESTPSVGVIHRRQKTGRLDKDSFLGRRPVLNRTHISHQLKDAADSRQ
jgi:hypothetical protein